MLFLFDASFSVEHFHKVSKTSPPPSIISQLLVSINPSKPKKVHYNPGSGGEGPK